MNKLAVIGNPIQHSLSPFIWTHFAQQFDIPLEYNKLLAHDDFELMVKRFFSSGGRALSVTAPFKARAFNFADIHNKHTQISQTANLLINKDQQIIADNTDGLGLVADLKRLKFSLNSKNILLVGSGSVIFSVMSSLLAENPARIDLLMRNQDKLVDFQKYDTLINAYNNDISYDLVINTTPNLLENSLFDMINFLSSNALVYDMIYTEPKTLFIKKMQKLNQNVISTNGIGMLIQQAQVAFKMVFNFTPVTDDLYLLLQDKFNG